MKITPKTIDQIDYAMYVPALQGYYTRNVYNANFRKLPKNMEPNDLDVLDPANETNPNSFHIPCALYSAGTVSNFVDPPDCIVKHRDRDNTVIIGDSGGFQIATGQPRFKNASRELKRKIFHWLADETDIAMTLDVPSWPLLDSKYKDTYPYQTTEQCLDATLANLKLFQTWNAELDQPHRFLNVLQGNTVDECDDWYDAVKQYPFYGWAISSVTKRNVHLLVYRILRLMEDGAFEKDETWIHFLGLGDLRTALIATCIRRCLLEIYPDCKINISFDTSTATLTGSRASYAMAPNWTNGMKALKYGSIPKSLKQVWQGSSANFPNQYTSIGHGLKKGDIIRTKNKQPYLDVAGYLLLMANNMEMQQLHIDMANKLAFDCNLNFAQLRAIFPHNLVRAMEAIETVFLGGDRKLMADLDIEHTMQDRWQALRSDTILTRLAQAKM